MTWAISRNSLRPGALVTAGDVCHLHPDRAAAERCGALMGGAPDLVRLDKRSPPRCSRRRPEQPGGRPWSPVRRLQECHRTGNWRPTRRVMTLRKLAEGPAGRLPRVVIGWPLGSLERGWRRANHQLTRPSSFPARIRAVRVRPPRAAPAGPMAGWARTGRQVTGRRPPCPRKHRTEVAALPPGPDGRPPRPLLGGEGPSGLGGAGRYPWRPPVIGGRGGTVARSSAKSPPP